MSILKMMLLALWPAMVAAADKSTRTTISHEILPLGYSSESTSVDYTQTTPLHSTYVPVTTITTGTTFTISTITSRAKATGSVEAVTTSPTAPTVDGKASINTRCERFRVNEGALSQHGNIWLDAYCKDDRGLLWHSVINLNHCLQNNGGVLNPLADGDFAQTCRTPLLEPGDPAYLSVWCWPGGGQPERKVDYDFGNTDVLSINVDGDFECFGIHGCAWNHNDCTDKPNGVNG